jgi:hypothetical protein
MYAAMKICAGIVNHHDSGFHTNAQIKSSCLKILEFMIEKLTFELGGKITFSPHSISKIQHLHMPKTYFIALDTQTSNYHLLSTLGRSISNVRR